MWNESEDGGAHGSVYYGDALLLAASIGAGLRQKVEETAPPGLRVRRFHGVARHNRIQKTVIPETSQHIEHVYRL